MPADPQQHGSTAQLRTSLGHKLKTLSSEVSKVPELSGACQACDCEIKRDWRPLVVVAAMACKR